MTILKVSEFDMERARRKLKKRIAAAIIATMAETDADYEFIAKRLGDTPANIEQWITGLIAGKTRLMNQVSDLMLAMGCEFRFSIERYEEPRRPTQDDQQSKQTAPQSA